MKISTPISSIMNVSLGSSYTDKTMDMAYTEYPVMEYLNKEGWAQPVRKNSQYSEDQKNILYVLFIKGQKSKKKVTPEEAVAEIRKKLPVDQFVKPKQVKVLFTRLSSLVKKGKLNMDIPFHEEEDGEASGDNDGNDEETWEFWIYENRQRVYAIHQMIKAIHVSFSYYEKGPMKWFFFIQIFSFQT